MAVAIQPAKRGHVWLIGDSLAVGLLKPLRARAAKDGVTLDGAPVGGTSVAHWTKGSIYVANIDKALPWAETFVVSLGTNDAEARVVPDIAPLVTHLQSKGARVVWIGPPQTKQPTLATVVASLRSQCDALGVRYIDSRQAQFQRAPGDSIHASPSGYVTWASWLWPRIHESASVWWIAGVAVALLAGWGAYRLMIRGA